MLRTNSSKELSWKIKNIPKVGGSNGWGHHFSMDLKWSGLSSDPPPPSISHLLLLPICFSASPISLLDVGGGCFVWSSSVFCLCFSFEFSLIIINDFIFPTTFKLPYTLSSHRLNFSFRSLSQLDPISTWISIFL